MGSQAEDDARKSQGLEYSSDVKSSFSDEKDKSLAIEPAQTHNPPLNEKKSYTATETPVPTKESPKGSASHGESILPGWTRMRPLRMKAMGRGKKPGEGTNGIVTERSGSEERGDKDLKGVTTNNTTASGAGDLEGLTQMTSDDGLLDGSEDGNQRGNAIADTSSTVVYKVYKRRWFGLVQLVLLNIIVSWDWLSYSASSKTCAEYYSITESQLNWLATGFLFAFVAATPFTILTLNKGGPKSSIITASVLLLLGNWIRYAATRSGKHGNFGGVMFGQILTGISQPFVLAAPTRYSDMWFTNRGRVAATAVMSLANPLGGALAQLIGPFWTSSPSDVPNLVLYISIIATVACVPSFFLPSHPPTPTSPSSSTPKTPLRPSLHTLFTTPEFYMIFLPFSILVGLFNSASSLINQILEPYSFTEDQAGIAGALLIVVGLVTAAVTSPVIDKTKSYLLAIKLQVPIIALSYLAFTFAPQTRELAAVYTILSILGAASFSLVPVVLEYITEITHPVSPEVTSTICWSGGQLLGGIFIVISDALRDGRGGEDDGSKRPPGNMYRALVFQAVVAMVAVPLPLCLGLFGRGHGVRMRRIEEDVGRREEGTV